MAEALRISADYSNILINLSLDENTLNQLIVTNRVTITQTTTEFESDITLDNHNITNVGTISPCNQINVGNLSLAGNTISATSGNIILGIF